MWGHWEFCKVHHWQILVYYSTTIFQLRGVMQLQTERRWNNYEWQEGNGRNLCVCADYSILYYTILYYTILYYIILYYNTNTDTNTVLYYHIVHYTTTLYTILYYTILYCTVILILYSDVLQLYDKSSGVVNDLFTFVSMDSYCAFRHRDAEIYSFTEHKHKQT
jgi:hypothetical protein